MSLKSSHGSRWTTYVLAASAFQRAGTFVATLFFVYYAGAERFAQVVPLLPIAPLVGAAALAGQDQAVLRYLVGQGSHRLDGRSTAAIGGFVLVFGSAIGGITAAAVALLFPVSFVAAAGAAMGGVLLAVAQASFLGQIRALRSGPAYVAAYSFYAAGAIAARVIALATGVPDDIAWAVGDVVAGAATLAICWATCRRLPGAAERYDLRGGLRYGAPLLPHSLAQQVLSNADRWIFAGRVPATVLATYVAVYQLANVVNIALAEVNRSRQHKYVGLDLAAADSIEGRERALLLGVIASLVIPITVASAILVPGDTVTTITIAIGICASFASIAFYLPLANVVSLTVGRTGALARASAFGAAANVALNIALVGTIGVWAGMVANLVGFFVMYAVLTRYHPR